MKKTKKEDTQQIVQDFLDALTIDGQAEVVKDEEGVHVSLQTKDSGMVIGYHGEVLEALQIVLSLYLSKKAGEFTRVSVEVGDYKKNRSDWLESMAMQAKDRALNENTEISLPNLKSWERRVVHMLLQNDPEVLSESVGEGKARTLIVKPRN